MPPVPTTKVGRGKVVFAVAVPKMIVGAGAAIVIATNMRAIQATWTGFIWKFNWNDWNSYRNWLNVGLGNK
jgi:hypothetical protein